MAGNFIGFIHAFPSHIYRRLCQAIDSTWNLYSDGQWHPIEWCLGKTFSQLPCDKRAVCS